jgi:hypothetical protein
VTQWPHTRGVNPDRRVFEDYLKLCERQLAQSDSGDLREASGG